MLAWHRMFAPQIDLSAFENLRIPALGAARITNRSTRQTWCCTAIRAGSTVSTARAGYSELWSAFPDALFRLDETLASGDRVAARYTLTGVQAQDFYGASATGAATNIGGMVWLRFRDGRVVEVWQASGTLDTLTRLSARAAKAPARYSASADAAALRWEETHPESDSS